MYLYTTAIILLRNEYTPNIHLNRQFQQTHLKSKPRTTQQTITLT